jgi:predicted dienelactone hydrolase
MRWTLLALLGCGKDDEGSSGPPGTETTPVPTGFATTGPFPVGTETVEITGTDGLALTVQLWYPASAAGTSTVMYDGLWPGNAFEGVAPDCGAARPLVAFSHGSGGIRWQSGFLVEHLASHGYVVVAPDHRGNTFTDLSGDYADLALRRPVDIMDSVDALPTTDLADCVALADGYAIAGHSFGGYTTLALAGAAVEDPFAAGELDLSDARVWAALARAPWDAGGALTDGTADIAVPTMILTGERDETTPIAQVRGLWDPMVATPRWLGVFPDAGHFSFSPVACAIETGDGCGEGFIDEATFTGLVAEAGLAFLEGARGTARAYDALPLDAAEIAWETGAP